MARTWTAVLAALALACGSGSRWGEGAGGGAGSGGGTDGGGDDGGQIGGKCTGEVKLSVEATNLGFFESLELDVARIEFDVIGGGVIITPAPGDVMVLHEGERKLLTSGGLPQDQVVDLAVFLDSVRACLPEHCLQMDMCTSPLRFRLDFWKVRDHCDVVLRIDVDHSVFADRERWAFVPRYALYY